MKSAPLSVSIVLGCAAISGFSQSEKATGLQNFEIVWSVPTNRIPEAIWIYKSTPQEFPEAVISNLISLGSFTMKDKRNRIPGQAPFKDKAAQYFTDKDETKHLGIFPSLGWIDYHDSTARAGTKEPIAGVPTEDEAQRLALKYLRFAGIDSSQLSIKSENCDLRFFREVQRKGMLDKASGRTLTEEILSRGFMFPRRIDGIDVGGTGMHGGVYVCFGNNGRIVNLQIVWRNLKPFKLRQTVSPEQIVNWIRNGQLKIPAGIGNAVDIRKVTLTQITLLYDGKAGDEKQDFVTPFARLDAVADFGHTNIGFQFPACPILQEK